MRKEKREFTDEEKSFLDQNYSILGCKECSAKLHRPRPTIYAYAKRKGLKLALDHLFRRVDISCFTALSDPFVIYFLGYFWADGTISNEKKHRIVFKIKSEDFKDLEPDIHRLGPFWNKRTTSDLRNPHWKELTCLDFTNKALWNFFNQYDYRIKSGTSADKILAAIKSELRHYWWRGFLDGDGHVSKNGRICFNSGIGQDWTFVEKLGAELNVVFTIERSQRKGRGGSKATAGCFAYFERLIKYLYQGESIGLKRKRQRCEAFLACSYSRKPHSSIYRGVSFRKNANLKEPWLCQISKDHVTHAQSFEKEIDAARHYDLKAKEFFGDQAILNFNDQLPV